MWEEFRHAHINTQLTHSPQHTDKSSRYTHSYTQSHVQLHTHTQHTPRDTGLRNTLRDSAITQQTEARWHTFTHYTLTHARRSWSAGRQHKVAEWTEGVSRETQRPRRLLNATGGGAVPPPAARPCPRPDVAAPPGHSLRPAAPGAAAARPRRSAPGPALPVTRPNAPRPRRRLASAACQRRAELAKQQTARHVGVGGRGAPIPPFRASGLALPGMGGGRRGDNLFRARAPHTHTSGTHTHPATAPSGGPGPRAHSHRPGAHHTLNIPGHAASTHGHTHIRSRHSPTHPFPAHLAFTRTHASPGGAHQPQTLPHVHIATQRTDTQIPEVFPRLHTNARISQAHTPHTRSLITRGQNPQSTLGHTHNTNT